MPGETIVITGDHSTIEVPNVDQIHTSDLSAMYNELWSVGQSIITPEADSDTTSTEDNDK